MNIIFIIGIILFFYLIKNGNSISSEFNVGTHLVGDTQCFPRATIDQWVSMNCNQVINRIIEELGIDLTLVSLEEVKITTDCHGNQEFWIDCYLQERSCVFNIRVVINAIKYVRKAVKEPKNKIFDYPLADQLVAKPMDVTIVDNGTIKNSSKPMHISQIERLKINEIRPFNSNLVVSYSGGKMVSGFNEAEGLAKFYGKWNGPSNVDWRDRNSWIRLFKGNENFPCRKVETLQWDNNGVEIVEPTRSNCSGINWAAQDRPYVPPVWPTIWEGTNKKDSFDWMFRPYMTQNPNSIAGNRNPGI